MPFYPAPHDSPARQAENALRRPSSAIWLRRVSVRTARFDEALQFYVATLGFTLGPVRVHPTSGQLRARLLDAEGRDVLELAETDAPAPPADLAFAMPRRTITLLRSRLDLAGVAYADHGGTLEFADVDGSQIRVEAL